MDLHEYWASLPRTGWTRHAACAGMDGGAFFDNQPESAKTVCARCPVIDDCLAWTLRVEPEEFRCRHGVFGGMGPLERHRFAGLLRKAGVSLHLKVAA